MPPGPQPHKEPASRLLQLPQPQPLFPRPSRGPPSGLHLDLHLDLYRGLYWGLY